VPNIEFKRVSQFSLTDVNSLPLSIDVNGVTRHGLLGNHNGFLDPGETIRVRVPLTNYTTNDVSQRPRATCRPCSSSDTPGVQVLQPHRHYGNRHARASTARSLTYLLR
jgi:hypothetical protein